MELLVGCLLERGKGEHARIVDEDVKRPELRNRFSAQMRSPGDDGDIRLNCEGVPARGLNLGDDAIPRPTRSVAKFTTTEAPAAAIAFAMPAPMPLAPPVTTATLPVGRRLISASSRIRFAVRRSFLRPA